MNNNPSYWKAGYVGWFICLHDHTAKELQKENDRAEMIRCYHVQGKERPCLILQELKEGYFLVWRLSSEAKTDFVELRHICRYGGKWKPSYLRTKFPNEICWVHHGLARCLYGKMADGELKIVLDLWRGKNGYGPALR